jgi:hypothetical protein
MATMVEQGGGDPMSRNYDKLKQAVLQKAFKKGTACSLRSLNAFAAVFIIKSKCLAHRSHNQ